MKKSLETLLEQIDWASYEYAVFAALQDAVEKYNTAYAQDATEKVSQVSLWTDPKVAVTAINFDTAAYYLRYRDFTAERYRRQNHEQWANELEAQQFQGDTTVFKHCDFVTLDHPEFHAVQEAGLWTHAQEAALLERINRSLLAVVEHAKQEGLFSRLHREPVIEVGVNSPRDWYDYTQIV